MPLTLFNSSSGSCSYIFTQKIDKCPNTRTHGTIAVIDGAERHLYRQAFIGHQLHQFTSRNFPINHVVRQAGNAVSAEAELFKRFAAV